MHEHTAAVIIISGDILSDKKEFNSCETLPLSLVPKWCITKLVVLLPNSQLVKAEIKQAFKMCEIVIVIQENDDMDLNVAHIIAGLFEEKIEKFRRIYDAKTLNNTPKLIHVNGAYFQHVISFQRIFLLRGDVPSIKSAFGVLKLYLNDYRKQLKYRKKFEILSNEDLPELRIDNTDIKIEKEIDKCVVTAETTQLDKLLKVEEKIVDKFGSLVIHRADDLNIFNSYYFQVDYILRQSVEVRPKKIFL